MRTWADVGKEKGDSPQRHRGHEAGLETRQNGHTLVERSSVPAEVPRRAAFFGLLQDLFPEQTDADLPESPHRGSN
jgi:hypothetical protein